MTGWLKSKSIAWSEGNPLVQVCRQVGSCLVSESLASLFVGN
jgi:hypothetical protein